LINQNSSIASTNEDKQINHLLINIDLPNIKFTKLLIILVETWEGKKSVKK